MGHFSWTSKGAASRYPIHYADPRLGDNTPTETTAYNERCREIARERFYLISEARQRCATIASQHAKQTKPATAVSNHQSIRD